MAERGFFAKIFGRDNADDNRESIIEGRSEEVVESTPEDAGTTLQDVVNFVAELQSYYYNDICKMQTDLAVQTLPENKINFMNKKIKQDQVALSQIDNILKSVRENEREFQSVWRKSIYSFYDEIEKVKLEKVQKKVFEIIITLYAVNTKHELERVILNRIEKYRIAWNIGQEVQLPRNYNVVLADEEDGIEQYYLGKFQKKVYTTQEDKVLSAMQLDKIRALKIEIEDGIPTNDVWVYVSSATRLQLNFMRRTCIIDNSWEYDSEMADCLCFDIVSKNELEQYIKGMLQIVLTKRTYSVISIFIPTAQMLNVIGDTRKNEDGSKVKICKKYRFILEERSGLYGNNLLTARIDRRYIPEELKFIPYLDFKRDYF